SKTAAGTGRQVPMNDTLFALLTHRAAWFRAEFGEPTSDQYLFPYGSPAPHDPSRPATTLKTAWKTVRMEAGVRCRLHDLRHTTITKWAEAGVSEGTMLALAGHMSRAMLERYSHVRLKAKREAMDLISETGVPAKVPTPSCSVPVA